MATTDEWDAMRERLMALTMAQLKAIAKDEGICLGYDGSRKDTTVSAIVSHRRHRALNGLDSHGRKVNEADWCRRYRSIKGGRS